MKIGLICPYNIFKGGGVQECVLAMQAELLKRGHDVYIITPTPRNGGVPAKVPERILLLGTATDVKSPFHTTAQVSVGVNTEALQHALDDHKFDVLHFHEPWVPILGRQILARSTSKNVATFHAKLPDTVMSKTIERVITPYTRSILKYLNAMTAVSDAGAEYIRSITDEKVSIIPNGIDLSHYTPGKKRSDNKVIVYIGRLEKRKGVKYLIRAFKELSEQHPDAELVIGGDGPDREKLEQLAADLELSNVTFLGYVSDEEKLSLLRTARVFCSPALYGESFGIVLLEAMACGLPVVAGNNPGYSSVMKGRGALSLVDPKHTKDFARKLELLLFDEDIRSLWQTWAKEYVQQFSYTRIVDQYEALYERVVG